MKERILGMRNEFNPLVLAEQANIGFLGLASFLMRTLTFQKDNVSRRRIGAKSPEESQVGLIDFLTRRLESVLRSRDGSVELNRNDAVLITERPEINRCFRLQLKELFHRDSRRRLAAVRWFHQRNCKEVIPVLEGILSIEEDEKVRRQVSIMLAELADINLD